MPSGTQHTRSHELDGPRKRHRTAIACDDCRERKRKCDGIKPVCGACSKRPFPDCVWNEERNTKGRDSSYVRSLRSRVKELEEAQGRHLATVGKSLESVGQANLANRTEYQNRPALCATDSTTTENAVETRFDSAGDHHVSEADAIASPTDTIFPMHISRTERTSVRNASRETLDTICGDNSTGVDAMGAACSLPRDETDACPQHRLEYFGPSSTVSFLSKARQAMGQDGPSSRSHHFGAMHPNEADFVGGFPSYKSRSLESIECGNVDSMLGLSVPPRTEADALVESYWTWFHPLYPFMHQPSFNERYLAVWGSTSTRSSNQLSEHPRPTNCYRYIGDRLFHCLLNAIFALGSHFNPAIKERNRDHTSLVFFERAKRLLDFDTLANGSLALVQTLLLMGQFLQSTNMSSACWNIVGMAIRVAQGIGLHHEPDRYDQSCCSKETIGQAETELRRRVWAGCVLLDRILSLAYGRPLMIHPILSHNNCLLPSAIDDQFLTQWPEPPGSQPENVISVIECYVQAIKLQEILGRVIATLYNESRDIGKDGREPGVGASLLISWHKSLPAHLKVYTYQTNNGPGGFSHGEQGSMFRRQANALETSHTKLPLDHDATDSTMEWTMLLKAASLCISVAQQLVSLVTDNAESDTSLLPPPWYSVFCESELSDSNTTYPETYETVSGRDANAGPPRADFSRFDAGFLSQNFQDDFAFDQLGSGWVGDSTDMTWLSYAPFLE
ncbi:fungal-specific transcription factor domain-containing protein [Penicillium atrosanguineum]|nr:fungal-specific transcription factor domain-containing protein [Penicillium atrosanguineum]